MNENYAIKHKTKNLIPIVNPGLKDKSGIESALLYRILPCKEIDSSDLIREAYYEYYGEDIPPKSDTILNAFVSFRDFCVSKLIKLSKKDKACYPLKNKKYRDDLNELIYLYLDDIFDGYDKLRKLYNTYFDLMYSFSNFMPVPPHFNGNNKNLGKGSWKLNNDYPIKYLENLNDLNSGIYNREKMLEWLTDNMEKYKIKDMYELQPPYAITQNYGLNDEKQTALENYLENAILCIKIRFNES